MAHINNVDMKRGHEVPRRADIRATNKEDAEDAARDGRQESFKEDGWDMGETKFYYIPRTFIHQIVVKAEFAKADMPDMFCIGRSTDQGFIQQILKQVEERGIGSSARSGATKNVHWLTMEQGHFLWRCSKGNLNNLRQFLEWPGLLIRGIEKISDIQDRIVILSAGPGMGKSTLLTRLGLTEVRESGPESIVLLINLRDHVEVLEKFSFKEEDDVVRFLQKIKCDDRYSGPLKFDNCILLFDGFDQVPATSRQKVIDIIAILMRSKVKKLWVTTRPQCRDDLENSLLTLSYSLAPFSKTDQLLFLRKYWLFNSIENIKFERLKSLLNSVLKSPSSAVAVKRFEDAISFMENADNSCSVDHLKMLIGECKKLKDSESTQLISKLKVILNKQPESREVIKNAALKLETFDEPSEFENRVAHTAEQYAAILVQIISESIYDKGSAFIGGPLLARMIAGAFQKRFEDQCFQDSKTVEVIDLLGLYEKLISAHYEAYFRCMLKANLKLPAIANNLSEAVHHDSNLYGKLALHTLFSEEELGSLSIGSHALNEIVSLFHDSSLVHLFNGKIIFIHRTFADYFAAYLIFHKLTESYKRQTDQTVLTEFLKKHVFNHDIKGIKYFLDCMLAGKSKVHLSVLNNNDKEFDTIIANDHQLANAVDVLGRTPLHLAASTGNVPLVRRLLENHGKLGISDKLFGWTPLNYADNVLQHENGPEVVEILLKNNADSKHMVVTSANVNRSDRYGTLLIHIAATRGYERLTEFLVQAGVNVNATHWNGKTPLHSAANAGKLQEIQCLISLGADPGITDNDGHNSLYWAIQNSGDVMVVDYLLKHPDVNTVDQDGGTPLHWARSNLKLIKFLVEEHHCNVNMKRDDGATPLHLAFLEGRQDIVEYLIEKGADLSSKTNDGDTVLHSAVQGSLETVTFLVEKHHFDVNVKRNDGATPLHWSLISGKQDIAGYLIEKGANLSSRCVNGDTVLHWAVRGDLESVKFLVERHHFDVNVKGKGGATPLHVSFYWGKQDIAGYLIEKEADLHSRCENGDTVLHWAIIGGLEAVKFLVERHHFDVNVKASDDSTPLHVSVLRGKQDIAQYLTYKGADPSSRSDDGSTVLHWAARSDLESVKFLVEEHHVDVNVKGKDGSTPLHVSLIKGKQDIAEYLIEKGAELSSRCNDGDTVLHWAVLGGLETVKFLVEKHNFDVNVKGKDGATPLHVSFLEGKLDIARYLIEKRADLKSRCDLGGTVLHWAAQGDLKSVKFLVESHHVDVNIKGNNGATPLHASYLRGKHDVARYLIEKGADVHSRCDNGDTVLHLAVLGDLEAVKYLVERHHVDVNAKRKDGATPLHLSLKIGKQDIAEYLIEKGAVNKSGSKSCKALYCTLA